MQASGPTRVLSLPGKDFSGNPYVQHFCELLEKAGITIINIHTPKGKRFQFDILHLHWPEFYVTERSLHTAIIVAPTVLTFMLVSKLLSKKIVWTVHDVMPVRARHVRLRQIYLFWVRVFVDAYVFMSPSSETEFVTIFPRSRNKISCYVPHGPYPVSKISPGRRVELREQLSRGENCLLVGFLGDLRPYKNLGALAYLPHRDSVGRAIKIVVAGAIDATYDPTEIEASLSCIRPERLIRIGDRLSDRCLAEMVGAVDVVFLPYLRGSNSGFSMFVLSCGQRLLCSALPMFTDLTNCLGPPWVYVFDHRAKDLSAELEMALSRFQHDVVDMEATSRLRAFLDDCSFDHGAQRLCQLYERLMN